MCSGGSNMSVSPEPVSPEEVRMGPQGRIVIPAALRKALALETGERLVVRCEGDTLVIEKRDSLIRRIQSRFARLAPEIDLVAELLAERRAETTRDDAT